MKKSIKRLSGVFGLMGLLIALCVSPCLAETSPPLPAGSETATAPEQAGVASTSFVSAQNFVPDVHIMIDVSGSMRRTDPNNIRIRALELLLNLLPKNARVGIWTFAKGTQELVPPGFVTPSWKADALKRIQQIHSNGVYTDIPAALDDGNRNWSRPEKKYQRSLIILTDGIVDVSKDPYNNELARDYIFRNIIPALKRNDVHVYALALSDKADMDLMQQLALDTNGVFHEIYDSSELQRMFFKTFEAAIEMNQLPLQNNRFLVDGSTKEITVMVFKRPGSPEIELQMPNRKILNQYTKSYDVTWHDESDYELITIRNPMPGRWAIMGATDPDNRVYLVSNLKLEVAPIPKHFFVNEELQVRAQLTEDGAPLTRPEVMKFVKMEVRQDFPEDERLSKTWQMHRAASGDFVRSIAFDPENIGVQQLVVDVNSKTFERSYRQTITVYPSPVQIVETKDSKTHDHILMIEPDPMLVKPETIAVKVMVTNPVGITENTRLERLPEKHEWRLKLESLKQPYLYKVEISVKGQARDGRKFSMVLPIRLIKGPPGKEAEVNELLRQYHEQQSQYERSRTEYQNKDHPLADELLQKKLRKAKAGLSGNGATETTVTKPEAEVNPWLAMFAWLGILTFILLPLIFAGRWFVLRRFRKAIDALLGEGQTAEPEAEKGE